ncbi:MAG: hypothetical protein ACYS29_11910 [Planctomycetota bacterium]|jgi:hypothetical protein
MVKQLVHSRLHPVWPEYQGLFSNTFGTTSMKLLQTASTPKELIELDDGALMELVRKASRGRFGIAQTQKLRQAAKNSVGMQRGHYGISNGIKLLLEQIGALTPVRKKLDAEIIKLAGQLPAYLFTLPGATKTRSIGRFCRVGPQGFPNRPV